MFRKRKKQENSAKKPSYANIECSSIEQKVCFDVNHKTNANSYN